MRALLTLAVASLRARRGRALLTFTGLLVALTFLTVMVAMARGFTASLEQAARASFVSGQVTVTPGVSGINRLIPGARLLELDDPRSTLDTEAVEALRARPDVTRVAPQVPFPHPVTARASLDGRGFELDMPLYGVDAELLRRDVQPDVATREGEIGLVLSRRLLDLYNLGLAPSSGDALPRLSEQGLLGFRFELEVGYSSFLQTRPLGRTLRVPVRVIGFTDQPSLVGATVTEEQAAALLERFTPGSELPTTYRTVLAFTADDAAAETLAADLRAEGYRAVTLASMLTGAASTAGLVQRMLGLLSLVVLLLALLTVATTMLTATVDRTGEIGLLRALGARRRDVVARFLLEAGLLGAAAGIAAAGIGAVVATAAGRALTASLPEARVLTDLVALDTVTLAAPIIAGTVVALLGALVPALRASSLPPVLALRSA